jgi:hypothetical protein
MSASNSSATAASDRDRSKGKDRSSKAFGSKALSTSAKRIQKELAEITLDPPPNCRYVYPVYILAFIIQIVCKVLIENPIKMMQLKCFISKICNQTELGEITLNPLVSTKSRYAPITTFLAF